MPRELRIAVNRSRGHPEISLPLRVAHVRPHDLVPAAVEAAHDPVDLVVGTRAVLRVPEVAGERVEGEAERVADAVSEVAGHRIGRVARMEGGVAREPRPGG